MLLLAAGNICLLTAQNVGIGTTTPQQNLHVLSAASSIIRNESTASAGEASLELKTNGASFDFLELRKWSTLNGGSVAGVPLAGLSTITTGSNTTGGLLIGTKGAFPTYFTTGNLERMRITSTGLIGIGTTSPAEKLTIDNASGTADPFAVVNGPLGKRTTIQADGILYQQGGFWVHSLYGTLRYGFPDKGWEFGTTNGGQDLQLWSYNPDYLTKSVRMYLDGVKGFVGIGTGNNAANHILEVQAGTNSGIYARSTVTQTDSAAIIGVLDVPSGANFRAAAVRGESKSTTSNSIGVYGLQNGGGFGVAGSVKEAGLSGWGAGVFGEAGLNGFNSGTGGYGVYAANYNNGGTAGYFQNTNPTGTAIKISGAIKVDTFATNKPLFIHRTAVSNISGHITALSYNNPLASDLLIVTPNWTAGPVYNAHPIGLYFSGGTWNIFNQDFAAMPVGTAFNVLVFRQ